MRVGKVNVGSRAAFCLAASATQLALHCGDTTLQLPFSPEQGKALNDALSKLLQTFADKQAAERPKRWDDTSLGYGPILQSWWCCIWGAEGVADGHLLGAECYSSHVISLDLGCSITC